MSNNYFSDKDFKQNLKKYEDARKRGTHVFLDSDDLSLIAEYYQNLGDAKRCKEAANYALELFPGTTSPLYLLARMALLEEHDTQKANDFIEQMDNKDDLEYLYVKAEILIFNGEINKADELLKSTMSTLDEEQRSELSINAASIFIDYQEMAKGEEWLNLCKSSDSDDYYELLAQIAINKGNYKKSESILNQLLDKEPYSTVRWNMLASAQYYNNDLHSSMTSSEFALAIDKESVPALINKANCLMKLGNLSEALEYYRRYLVLVPNDINVYFMVASALITINKINEAKEFINKAEEIIPHITNDVSEVLVNMIHILNSIEDFDKSLIYIDKLSKVDKNQIQTHLLRGEVMMENDNIKEGLANLNQSFELSNNDPYICLSVAIILYDAGLTKLAYKYFNTLLKIIKDLKEESTWADGYSYIALCAQELEEYDVYFKFLKLAVERNPEEAKFILGPHLPEDLDIEEYYKYAVEHPEYRPEDKEQNNNIN